MTAVELTDAQLDALVSALIREHKMQRQMRRAADDHGLTNIAARCASRAAAVESIVGQLPVWVTAAWFISAWRSAHE